ncbi:hypothetical protein EON71_01300, partial [bacterium]
MNICDEKMIGSKLSQQNISELKNSNDRVEYIYHLSDIHIRPRDRHNEYNEVFTQTLVTLKKNINNKINKSLIVLTGDIVHNKTDMSPELISILSKFLNDLANIADVIMIPGNHDCNLSNRQRMDALTPIVDCLNKHDKIFYLKNSGYYNYKNIIFGVSSVIDDIFLPSPSKDLNPKFDMDNKYKIALFHGAVHGSVTDVGHRMNTEDLVVKDFKGYDYVLLGDIHKYQYMDNYKRIAYSGSLIQQSFGEKIEGHGILKWNLRKGLSKMIEIKNNYGYFKLNIKNGILSNDKLLPNSTISCILENTTNAEYNEIVAKLKKNYNICEIKPQNSSIRSDYAEITNDNLKSESSNDIIQKYASSIG